MKKPLYSPPVEFKSEEDRQRAVAAFNSHLDGEAVNVKEVLGNAIGRAGIAKPWSNLLGVVPEVAADGVAELVKATHPDSPGGRKVTQAEIRRITRDIGEKLASRFIEVLGVEADEPKPSKPEPKPSKKSKE
jgi:hypothetical protein